MPVTCKTWLVETILKILCHVQKVVESAAVRPLKSTAFVRVHHASDHQPERHLGSVTGHPEIDGQYAAAWVTFSSQRKMDELMNTF